MSASPLGQDLNCKISAGGSVTNSASTSVIGPLTFTGGTEVSANANIQSIAICNNAVSDYALCNVGSGIAFAVVDTNDVTLAADDTVQITYTFDVTSPGT